MTMAKRRSRPDPEREIYLVVVPHCKYPDPDDCPHHNPHGHACEAPTVGCTYRTYDTIKFENEEGKI